MGPGTGGTGVETATGTGTTTGGTGGACPPVLTPCDDGQGGIQCVNLDNNPMHCGECGNACDIGESCQAGECQD